MKKASLLIALCLFLLPAVGLANQFTFVVGLGTITDVGIATCGPAFAFCGPASNISSTNAPIDGVVGTPVALGSGTGTMTFVTSPLYATSGTPMVDSSWAVTWITGGSIVVSEGPTLVPYIGGSVGDPVFTGTFTNGGLASADFGPTIKLWLFTGGVIGTYSENFLDWACPSCVGGKTMGTLSLSNSAETYFKGVGIANGALTTLTQTPEPATLSLLGMGLLGIGGLLRRRR